jgi:PEP-CTERM putative exosortase interaction domain
LAKQLLALVVVSSFSVASHAAIISSATYTAHYESDTQLDLHFEFADTIDTDTFSETNLNAYITSATLNDTLYTSPTEFNSYLGGGLSSSMLFIVAFGSDFCGNHLSLLVPCDAYEFPLEASSEGYSWSFDLASAPIVAPDGTVDVPEPPALILMGLGIFGLVMSRRKQARSAKA